MEICVSLAPSSERLYLFSSVLKVRIKLAAEYSRAPKLLLRHARTSILFSIVRMLIYLYVDPINIIYIIGLQVLKSMIDMMGMLLHL